METLIVGARNFWVQRVTGGVQDAEQDHTMACCCQVLIFSQ
jgi:hypothetical protein